MDTLLSLGATVAEGFDQAANAATVLKVAPLEDAVGTLAVNTGFPADQLKTLLALLAAYPLSMIQLRLPSATARHAFSAIVGLFLAQFVFGSQFFHSFVSCVVVYAIMSLAPRSQSPMLVFIFTMLYLTISHVYRMYIDYMGWTLDHTGPQMILTIKLSTLAWDVYDGTAGKKRAEALAEKNPKLRPMVEGRRKRSLDAMPSVLEYLSFVYHFSSFFAGPAFIMRDYKAAMEQTSFVDKGGKRLPSGTHPKGMYSTAVRAFVTAVVCLGLFVTLSPTYKLDRLLDEDVLQGSTLRYVWMLWFGLLVQRFKYYFGWKMAEGGCVLAGIGFRGYDEKTGAALWDGASNIDILAFELATSVRDLSKAWNCLTQKWLQHYVYERVPAFKMLSTYFISAFWHGFYPGYYLMFLSVIAPQQVGRLSFRKVHPLFHGAGPYAQLAPLYRIVSTLLTSLTINYLVSAFVVLSFERAITVWSRLYFAGHIWFALCYVTLKYVFPSPKVQKKHM